MAIEGIDGSGKGTQAQRLYEQLTAMGTRVELLSFPRYDATLFGKVVGDFLNGRFGTLVDVNPYLASLLYAGDRFESRDFLLASLEENEVVILDRYVASNIAHQASKLIGQHRDELVDWISNIEYNVFQLPKPDLVILLDLPASESQKLIALKQARSYTNKKADLQEADGNYLEKVRDVYLQLADDDSYWETIECFNDEKLKSIEEVGQEISNVLEHHKNE